MLHLLNKTVKKKSKFKPGKPFNPNFDGNLLAWYDGDTLTTDPVGTWSDSSGNGNNLSLFNGPTIINNGLNNHDTLQFDGISQYGKTLTPVTNQPYSMYLVFKEITWVNNNAVFDDGISFTFRYLWMTGGSPNLNFFAGNNITLNPSFILNNFNILTCVANTVNSEVRTNNNVAVVGNAGAFNGQGLTIGSDVTGLARFTNTEFAYIIIRTGADNTATQNLFINFLKTRFAL